MTSAPSDLTLTMDAIPLRADPTGAVRIGNTRIGLDLIVEQYENGMTPEELVLAYDALELADVHFAIAYYLRHREEVRAYLRKRAAAFRELRSQVEATSVPLSRGELTARRRAAESGFTTCGG